MQNAAFAALAQRLGPAIAAEIDYGLYTARLPAATNAVGQFAFTAYIPALIEALADDVLGEPAYRAILRFGGEAAPLLVETLGRHDRNIASLQRAIAAANLLGQLSFAESTDSLIKLLSGAHPALAAAVALALINQLTNAPAVMLAAALTRGTLLPNATLAERCLDVIDTLLSRDLLDAASSALAMEYLPDLYGVPRSVRAGARARLIACLLQRSDMDATEIIDHSAGQILLAALRLLRVRPAETNVAALRQHPDLRVRQATAHTLSRDKC